MHHDAHGSDPGSRSSPSTPTAGRRTCATRTTRSATSPTIDDAPARRSSSPTSAWTRRTVHLRRALPPGRGAAAASTSDRRRRAPAARRLPRRPRAGSRPRPTAGDARYTERYEYDVAGNLRLVHHAPPAGLDARLHVRRSQPPRAGHAEQPADRDDDGRGLNRVETYPYDVHGNMTAMPHLPSLPGTTLTSCARCDSSAGRRTTSTTRRASGRKVSSASGRRRQERIYLGGFEVYREYDGDRRDVTLERETLHVRRRPAARRARGDAHAGRRRHRRSWSASSSATTSARRASSSTTLARSSPTRSTTRTGARATGVAPVSARAQALPLHGKERDEETGLVTMARATTRPGWGGGQLRPARADDGPNAFTYARCNPQRFVDPGGMQADQWELIEQSELRHPVTATAAGRGISQTLRGQYQALWRQWALPGDTDVGHEEPFELRLRERPRAPSHSRAQRIDHSAQRETRLRPHKRERTISSRASVVSIQPRRKALSMDSPPRFRSSRV